MSLNWKEINLILDELNLKGSFIRQIHQPHHDKLVLDIYNRQSNFKILISLSNPDCRIHMLTKKLKNPDRPKRFTSFLRAHIKNGRILAVEHVNNDRIIKFIIIKAGVELHMWIRLWTGASNIIVTDKTGKILETFYRKKKRNEITGETFNPVKPDNKKKEKDKYQVRELPGSGTFNHKIESFFFDNEFTEQIDSLRNSIIKNINSKMNGIEIKLENAYFRKNKYQNYIRNKQIGNLIEANIHNIKKGDLWLKADDFFNSNQPLEIQLNPNITAVENAKIYYKKYKKQKGGLENIDKEIDFLNKTYSSLNREKDKILKIENIEALRRHLKPEEKIKKKEENIPGMVFTSKEFKIIVGRKAADNDILLRKYIKGNDYWLHVRDYPGAYVFIKYIKGKSIPLEVLLDAGSLAVFYSKGKASGQGNVYYTQAKYLRKPKNGKKGLVIPTQEKNLYIKLEDTRLNRLLKI